MRTKARRARARRNRILRFLRTVRDVQRRGYPITIHERDEAATLALSPREWAFAVEIAKGGG